MSAEKVNCTGGATLFSSKQLNFPVESTCALKVDMRKSYFAPTVVTPSLRAPPPIIGAPDKPANARLRSTPASTLSANFRQYDALTVPCACNWALATQSLPLYLPQYDNAVCGPSVRPARCQTASRPSARFGVTDCR